MNVGLNFLCGVLLMPELHAESRILCLKEPYKTVNVCSCMLDRPYIFFRLTNCIGIGIHSKTECRINDLYMGFVKAEIVDQVVDVQVEILMLSYKSKNSMNMVNTDLLTTKWLRFYVFQVSSRTERRMGDLKRKVS